MGIAIGLMGIGITLLGVILAYIWKSNGKMQIQMLTGQKEIAQIVKEIAQIVKDVAKMVSDHGKILERMETKISSK